MTVKKEDSKYYTRSYIGEGIEGVDELGYAYHWNSTHEDLEPTSTFKSEYREYCSYCRSVALPIHQPYIKKYEDYGISGHTCSCDAAEAEKEYRKEYAKLLSKQKKETEELQSSFRSKLEIDTVEILKIKQRDELKREEWMNGNRKDSYFSSVNGKYTYQ